MHLLHQVSTFSSLVNKFKACNNQVSERPSLTFSWRQPIERPFALWLCCIAIQKACHACNSLAVGRHHRPPLQLKAYSE
jgi:hypothetical protein